jgi:hypothetical protein
MKRIIITFSILLVSFASFALTPILGSTSTCIGGILALHDTTTGGTWTSSNTAIATVGYSTGVVSGIAAGTVTITYTLGTYVTTTVTVSGVMPGPITGITTFCVGTTSTLSDATPGGVWSSSSYIASVGSGTGIVTGAYPGSTTINYTLGACSSVTAVTISSTPPAAITGPNILCVGATITLADSFGSTGGIWSSDNTTPATVSGGVVSGISPGLVTISYALTGTCGTTYATKAVTVSSVTSPGTITGPSTVFIGAAATLYDGAGSGVWSSANTSIAPINSSGVVSGLSLGSTTITYTVSGCGGTAYTTAPITVAPFNGISGHVLFTGSPYAGYVKVYLITYNPSIFDLEAIDSTIVVCSGTSAYYQFNSVGTDSFRIKAAVYDTGSMGHVSYLPTYFVSNFYWYSASVIYHTSGSYDINKNITMLAGIPAPGPGFIGGNVLSGANKGTAGSGAAGITIYLLNSVGVPAQQTTTDASGNYGFSALPLGTYTIFPELLGYMTTAYTSVDITTSATSVSAANFIQHTISHTIAPVTNGVNNMPSSLSSIFVFPNPSNGKVNMQWNAATTEKATVTLSDITGRQVFSTTVNMNQGVGTTELDLSVMTNGLYMISVKSASLNYNNKLDIQK